MNVNGIIAEYNPFHNGHKYQLEESGRLTGAEYTVVVMSGNFVQRGAPALVDKRLRTEMALRCGADLVLELPVLYATASSEYFAAGAVALLDKLGTVTHLCFGSECGDAAALGQIAAFFAEEPESYRADLKRLLKHGLSYPDARARALSLQSDVPETRANTFPPLSGSSENAGKPLQEQTGFSGNGCDVRPSRLPLPDNCAEILSSPNNILGIDYIKEIIKRKSSIIPVTVKRLGAGYHDALLPEDTKCPKTSPISALAIRQILRGGQLPSGLRSFMPEEVWQLLHTRMSEAGLVYPDSLSGLLYYKLLLEREQGYEKYLDVSADLSNRIRNGLNRFTGFIPFCDLLKTKAFTHTRISRCLLHILLDIEADDMRRGRAQDDTPYARVLGFRKSARPLLHAVRAHSSIPLITKLADAPRNLPAEADRLLKQDILASEIYQGIAYGGTGQPAPNEFSTPLVIL